MTEFEKKSLCYALTYAWFCLAFLLPQCRDFLDDYHLLLLAGAFVILLLLYYVFGLWKTAWTSGGYLREDNLTERELFLSYKATSKTLVFFMLLSLFIISGGFFHEIAIGLNPGNNKMSDIRFELTCDILDFFMYGMAIMSAFISAKSLVLYTYLRKEPRELPEVH